MKYTSMKQVKDLYKSVFYMEEDMIIDAILAITIATKLQGDPIWLLIIGGSSSGKSELVNMVNKVPFVHPVSSLTENSFMSSMKGVDGKENSLLHQIGTNGMIVMKDYTSILAMRSEKRDNIVSQMREIYDGEYEKKSGNGNSQKWKGKINWIGAVTDSIYIKEGESAGMGRRTINYVMPLQDRKKTIRAASRNTDDIEEKRNRIQDAVKDFIMYKIETLDRVLPPLSEEVENDIVDLSDFLTIARTPTERNYRGDLILVPDPEGGTRVFSMFKKIVQVMAHLSDDGKFDADVYKIMSKLAMDSIPKQRIIPLKILAKYPKVTKKGAAVEANYPTETMGEWLENLNVLGIVKRKEIPGGSDQWIMNEEYRTLVQKFANVKPLNDMLIDSDTETDSGDEIQPTWLMDTGSDDKGTADEEAKKMKDLWESF